MRRGVGIHGLDKQKRHREGFQKAGEQLAAQQLETMGEQLSKFKSNLHQFACKYKQDIAKDAVFRRHFQQLCTQVGVDPLASNKGFWASMLGIGDFYYELAVQIIQICIETRDRNGGLLALDELSRLLVLHRGQNSQMISEYSILIQG